MLATVWGGVHCSLWLAAGAVAIIGFALLCICAAIVIYNKYTMGICDCENKMDGKTVLITGANGGIGKETARDLARRGARVIMACRNMETAKTAQDEIIKETGNQSVFLYNLDLSSMESVRKFAKELHDAEDHLDVLIHNAGTAQTFRKIVTSEGLEATMATNHYGPFLLTHLVIDLLKKREKSRIVVVASELYRLANVDLRNPNPVTSLPGYLYYVSKYANILFTRELASRLEGTGITANCLHPGMIDSGIWNNVPLPLYIPLLLIIKGFFKTTTQGAQTSIHLAVSDKVEGINGKYFMDCKETTLSRGVKDEGKAKKFWEISEELCGLTETDPKIGKEK